MLNNWWNSFFKEGWQNIQHVSKTPEETKLEVDFIIDLLSRNNGEEILDVPCGDGRITIELAMNGFKMTGIDFNKEVIEIAKDKSLKRDLNIEWIVNDMRKTLFNNKFDAALCIFGSFGYFDDKGNIEFINSIYNSLNKNGIFLIDTHCIETLLPNFQEKGFFKIEDYIILEERCFDYLKSRIETDWTFINNSKYTNYHSSIRLYSIKELINILNESGFGDFETYGSYNNEPFEFRKSKRLLLKATKI